MKVDKRRLLRTLVTQDLWKRLSSEEVRLYLLFITVVNEENGTGKVSEKDLKRYLGHSFSIEEVEETASTFLELRLAKINYFFKESGIEFKLL